MAASFDQEQKVGTFDSQQKAGTFVSAAAGSQQAAGTFDSACHSLDVEHPKSSFSYGFLSATVHSTRSVLSSVKGSFVYLDLVREAEELPLAAAAGGTSTTTTTMNLITVMVGAGVLGFPKLFATVGLAAGTFLVIFCCATSIALCTTLGNAIGTMDRALQQVNPNERIRKMDDLGRACFGKPGEMAGCIIVNAMFVGKLGCYMVLIGQGLNFFMSFFTYKLWVLLVSLGFSLPVAFLRDITVVEKMGPIGVLAAALYFVLIIGAAFRAAGQRVEPFNPLPSSTSGQAFSVLATMMFGFGPADVLATVRREMARPEELPQALMRSHIVSAIIYLAAGCIGYWGWGSHVEGNISQSMCDAPGCAGTSSVLGVVLHGAPVGSAGAPWWWGYVLAVTVVVSLLVTIPIIQYCLFTGIESRYPRDQPMSQAASSVMRVSTVFFSCCIGLFVPFFLQVLGIISALLVVPLVFVLPICFSWKVAKDHGEPHGNVRLLMNVLGLCLAVALLVIGLSQAVSDLNAQIQKDPAAANPMAGFFN